MATDNGLHRILEEIATKMESDFRRSGIVEHRGSKGTVREDVLRNFLEDYVLRSAAVSGSGELISSSGQRSGQCDVMIIDAITPPLWKEDSYRIVPIECCEAVIEVKSNLTVAELERSWAAATRVKMLPRTAYLPSKSLYTSHAMPPQVHLFAYESASMDTLGAAASRLSSEGDHTIGLDSLCILDKGFFTWGDLATGNIGKREPNSQLMAYTSTSGSVLLFLLSYVNKRLMDMDLRPRFDMDKYVHESLGQLHGIWPDVPPEVLHSLGLDGRE
ncbi:hypothetical protein M3B90_09255 [Dermabacter sp. p3-SID358]|uniref:DUF6602 domain-containing protein n=1 Tax=Dermabacter sp. p3-SID358 TaxID=2916114 RepID=UPI0021A60AA7|nr:DUF6602 domain-containing protein [Dermabacter sp. p3-SID358]MCT1867713.1 hypothetical protein [Dermabacter sp. p3-SID358]